ncbi:glycerophosphodiester phosphodiesterase [Brachybacterium timonense]|uniref:glycerophosphodiester phosphodiesterase n=1 Tax=Brachybacterium timonense TaxID=2050896 RepID=UPI000D0AFDE9|nr:glycerophosphodiester phosphodiesterase [Brachybacterium timonense]
MTAIAPAETFQGFEPFTVVSHRGDMTNRLENTLDAFQRAEELGSPEMELDIHPTADGHIVVHHDATLDRLAADDAGRGLGPLRAMTLDRLRQVELRGGHRVHTFAEICAGTHARLQVEIKDADVVPLLTAYLREHPDHASRMIITSFDADALEAVHRAVPTVRTGIIVMRCPVDAEHPEGLGALLERTGSVVFHCGWEGLTPEVVAEQHVQGRRVHVWPVRTEDDLRRALALGADGTTVDDPQEALTWLARLVPAEP